MSNGYNIRRNLNSYSGRNKYSVALGTTRNIKGSSNRIYNYCQLTSDTPLVCMFNFSPPNGEPEPEPIKTVPSAPIITSIVPTSSQISIYFTAPSDGGSPITDYLYSLDNGVTFISSGTTSSPIVVTGLSPGTTYQVKIRAVNLVGDGQESSASSVTTDATVPSAPTITSIVPTSNQITINFTAPSDGGSPITNYKYSLDNGVTFISSGTTVSPITVTGLSPGTTYQVKIRAVNSVGDGQESSASSVTTDATVPSAPTITSIVPTSSQITINFTAPSDGGSPITNYKYSLDNGVTFISSGTSSSPIVVTGLSPFITYNVIIRAVNSVGDGLESNTSIVTTLGNWYALGTGLDNSCNAIDTFSTSDVYIGGTFNLAGSVNAKSIAKWNYVTWSPLGTGLGGTSNSCFAIAVAASNRIYIGGNFTQAGGVNVNRIALWNGTTFSRLGSLVAYGVNGDCNTIAVKSSTQIYVGGAFTTAGNINVNRIALWNGTSWSSLGGGLSGIGAVCNAIAVDSGTNVYTGGTFTTAGTTSVSNIARWNGSSWFALGTGLNGTCNAIAVDSLNNVYVGGNFTTAGGVTVNRIAMWNPSTSTWSSLGTGLDGICNAIAVDSLNNVYAGGNFTTAGGTSVSNIAKWDGSNWYSIGGLTGGSCRAIKIVSSTNIFIGGAFTNARGISANRIAYYSN